MRQKVRSVRRFFFAVCLLGFFLTAESLQCEELQSASPFVIKSPLQPEGSALPEIIVKDGDSDRIPLFRSLSPPPDPMTGRERVYSYLNRTFGYSTLIGRAAVSGFRQASNSVPEWGGGMDGYSAYYASAIGRRMIQNSLEHGLSGLLRSDPRYYRSGRSGVWNRSLYAAGQTLVAHTESGEERFAYAHVLGTVGSVFLSRTWYPENRRTVEEYFSSVATSFASDAAGNLLREFWPDIKRYIFK